MMKSQDKDTTGTSSGQEWISYSTTVDYPTQERKYVLGSNSPNEEYSHENSEQLQFVNVWSVPIQNKTSTPQPLQQKIKF